MGSTTRCKITSISLTEIRCRAYFPKSRLALMFPASTCSNCQWRDLRGQLFVDGDILVRSAVGEYLRECGYTAIEAASTDEAVTFIERAGLDIDISAPAMSAAAAKSAGRMRTPTAPTA